MNDLLHCRGATHAPARLVGDRDGHEQIGSGRGALFGAGNGRRNELNAGVTAHEEVAFVEVLPHAGGSIEQRCVEPVRAPARPDHRARAGGDAGQVARAERFQLCGLHAGSDHREDIGDDGLGAREHRLRDIGEARARGELREALHALEQDVARRTQREVHAISAELGGDHRAETPLA
jgi:hypothetical protein